MIDVIPFVTILGPEGKLVTVSITKCDQCGVSLLDKQGKFKWDSVHIVDDAVRVLYFCSEKCRTGFLAQAKTRGHFPEEKLRVDTTEGRY